MKATIPYIEQKFEEFNQQMFGGQLPKLPIELSDARTFLGKCVAKKRKSKNGKSELYDFQLRINTRIDLPEKLIEDTIIHEMIHYFIGYNQLEDTNSHGPIFLHMMNTINEKYGRNVEVVFKGDDAQKEQAIDTRQLWHVIAVISFKDGKTGIKVLPRIIPRILNYYNTFAKDKNVRKIELYMTNNAYFNRYPNSSALKAQYVEEKIIRQKLDGAEKMECDGVKLIRKK